MNNTLKENQHKRIVALSTVALILGYFALWKLGEQIFVDGVFVGWVDAKQSIYLFSACTLMVCSVVVIAVRSFQDDAKIRYLENHDQLTGLSSKSALFEEAEQALKKHQSKSAVLFLIDVARLKSFNSSLGRDGGDQILRKIAERLKYLFADNSIISRFGAGTFAVVIPGIEKRESVEELAKQIHASSQISMTVNHREIFANLFQSACIFSIGENGVEHAMRKAEIALAESKLQNSTTLTYYDRDVADRAEVRGKLETDFRQVLESTKLEPFFQPLLASDGKTLIGFEALARWYHSTNGFMSPASFIPLAEELGYAGKLGVQIMRKACKIVAPMGNLIVAVNVSAKHFLEPDFVCEVLGILRETGLSPERLELEITESVFVSKATDAITAIEELRALGISVALDDFGTGYSGLSYLNKYKVDRIKIDAEFIRELETSEASRSMVATIVKMASDIDCKVTVEGVETQEQFKILKKYPNLCYQGYLFGKPVSAEQLHNLPLMTEYNRAAFLRDGIVDYHQATVSVAESA